MRQLFIAVISLLIPALALGAPGDPTNLTIIQGDTDTGRTAFIEIVGEDHPHSALGFNASGEVGPISIGHLDVKQDPYLAVGDDTNDDTAELSAALAALPAGATLYFPAGTYKLTAGLTNATNNITLQGSDNGGTIIHWSTLGGSPPTGIAFTGDNVTIRNISFRGPGVATSYTELQSLISVIGTTSDRVQGLTIENCDFRGVGSYGVYAKFVNHASVTRSTFSNIAYAGAIFISCDLGVFERNFIDMINTPVAHAVGSGGNAYGVTFTHVNTAYAADPNAGTPLAANPFCNSWDVSNNTVRGPKIWQAIDTHGAYSFHIVGNHTYGARDGIAVTTGSGGSTEAVNYAGYQNKVLGNVIDSRDIDGTAVSGLTANYGMTLQGGSSAAHHNFTVVGNTVRGYGSASSSSASISLDGYVKRFVVTGNTFDSWSNYGIYVSGAVGGVITDNVFGDHQTSIVEDGGAATIASCIDIRGASTASIFVAGNTHTPASANTFRAKYGLNLAAEVPAGAVRTGANDFARAYTPFAATAGQAVSVHYGALTATGGITGTTTNDSATALNIGEHVSTLVAVGSAVSLTTATSANVTSISLTAGDWDVEANINFTAASATVTASSAGITVTSATVPSDGSEIYSGQQSTTTSFIGAITAPRKRISLASTTTVYLVARSTFSAGTVGAFGAISARRVR